MASTINADDGVISGSAGVKTSADASGELALQANGSTAALLTALSVALRTNSLDRFLIGAAGQLGIGGANYGTSGQVLTSNGAASAPSWQLPAGLPPVTVTASTSVSAVAGNHYVLTAATAATVTLPTSPVISDTVWITVANGRVDNVVARNGQNIQGLAENMTLNAPYAAAQLRFSDATEGWVMI